MKLAFYALAGTCPQERQQHRGNQITEAGPGEPGFRRKEFKREKSERSCKWCLTSILMKYREFKAERDRIMTKLV